MHHRLYKFSILGALVLLALLLGACIQEEPPTPESPAEALAPLALAGTAWQYEYLGEKSDDIPVIEGTRPTLAIFLTRYAGNGGCNFYMGGYTAGQLGLQLNQPAVTLRQCDQPEGVMEQEISFIGALANTTETRIDGENLVLYTVGEQPLLTLAPLQTEAATSPSLEGATWSLAFMVDGGEVQPVLDGTEVTAQFADGQVSGSAGCNNYSGSATIDGDSLTFGPLMSTQMFCADPEGVSDQESAYLATLASVAAYQQIDDMLVLMDADDNPLLTFSMTE